MQDMGVISEHREYEYSVNPSFLTKFLKVMLFISIGTTVLLLISNFMQFELVSSGIITKSSADANDTRQHFLSILRLAIFIVTSITFLMWIYRANKNAQGFSSKTLEFTPGWAVGYFFIPVVSLYLPYRAMREIWRVSSAPDHWRTQPGSALLQWWWAVWLASNFSGFAAARFSMHIKSLADIQHATIASILSNCINILAYILALSVVVAISTKQRKLVDEGSGNSFDADGLATNN
ncbi:hypothetical protein ASD68_11780 [Rhodanobacter sp. Root627]|uniref:DUF4328 domain-containing protein n=1 Tax=Rhodanobacter sp. Root627 TaxID=1736572 RepID=UPI0006FCBF23|nr:DUF4328 domain-containing protein [Rhodanobacter sp. Root627]KRA33631.1 hypothetical protein ASD68_11780 [Rhodanobacter sp. Root627]